MSQLRFDILEIRSLWQSERTAERAIAALDHVVSIILAFALGFPIAAHG